MRSLLPRAAGRWGGSSPRWPRNGSPASHCDVKPIPTLQGAPEMSRMSVALTLVVMALASPAALATPPATSSEPTASAAAMSIMSRPCFGAPARNPFGRCVDPSLRLTVLPAPDDAALEPNAPCQPQAQGSLVNPCAFGVDRVFEAGHDGAHRRQPRVALARRGRRRRAQGGRARRLDHAHGLPVQHGAGRHPVAPGCGDLPQLEPRRARLASPSPRGDDALPVAARECEVRRPPRRREQLRHRRARRPGAVPRAAGDGDERRRHPRHAAELGRGRGLRAARLRAQPARSPCAAPERAPGRCRAIPPSRRRGGCGGASTSST